ncbi:hypothetical protein [Blastopirellula marina]|uniref:Uncharacterized protein n=1 Tax=Blastopirellula marina TaxID=124 RepID=A0A2S8FTN0_9BACT|nr:hypothetical protein [Blastopirellula marina]PQO35194.1 hypothetical protein C5Y98_14690 [Blastopirellula marina]PQO47985.1 hypothetical protein C5Y93_00940 [Blastopirellula marina]PTL43943.1 hypothetical protein C5Y97_14700 [Blastopirellula marina]
MGNSFRRIVLAPDVPASAVADLARLLRRTAKRPGKLILGELSELRFRKPPLQLAQELGVRVIDGDLPWAADWLYDATLSVLGENAFLLRDCDDEEVDAWRPRATWLKEVYGTDQLDWLVDPEEPPSKWRMTPYYVFPRNPPDWDVDVPIMAALLIASAPGESRDCPLCGQNYVSKFLRGQCPGCRFVFEAFASPQEARRILPTRLDRYGYGKCDRCRKSTPFAAAIEQCMRCGQLLEESSGATMPDNRELVKRHLASLPD